MSIKRIFHDPIHKEIVFDAGKPEELMIMELIDTPNPNAKKIMTDLDESLLLNDLNNIDGISSVFFGPGFITVSKLEDTEWEMITQEINNIFDKL